MEGDRPGVHDVQLHLRVRRLDGRAAGSDAPATCRRRVRRTHPVRHCRAPRARRVPGVHDHLQRSGAGRRCPISSSPASSCCRGEVHHRVPSSRGRPRQRAQPFHAGRTAVRRRMTSAGVARLHELGRATGRSSLAAPGERPARRRVRPPRRLRPLPPRNVRTERRQTGGDRPRLAAGGNEAEADDRLVTAATDPWRDPATGTRTERALDWSTSDPEHVVDGVEVGADGIERTRAAWSAAVTPRSRLMCAFIPSRRCWRITGRHRPSGLEGQPPRAVDGTAVRPAVEVAEVAAGEGDDEVLHPLGVPERAEQLCARRWCG